MTSFVSILTALTLVKVNDGIIIQNEINVAANLFKIFISLIIRPPYLSIKPLIVPLYPLCKVAHIMALISYSYMYKFTIYFANVQHTMWNVHIIYNIISIFHNQ